jgi:hypothetical protein
MLLMSATFKTVGEMHVDLRASSRLARTELSAAQPQLKLPTESWCYRLL